MSAPVESVSPQSVAAMRRRISPPTWASTLQVRRFAVVGVLNTFIDYLLFVALTKILRLPLDWVWIAKILSGTVAISISFYLNRRWVFRASGASFGQAARFLATAAIGIYGIQTSLTQFFASSQPELGKELYRVLQGTHLSTQLPSVLTEALAIKTVAFALATSVSMTFNFLVYKFWVFRPTARD
jgi:putative flippase GtrA